jgi:hypothetical protein
MVSVILQDPALGSLAFMNRLSAPGTFTSLDPLPTGSSPVGVVAADVTGDGFADIVTVNNGSRTVSLFRGDGAGGFGAREDHALETHPTALALADVDRDGIVDVLALTGAPSGSTGVVSVLRGLGTGTFAPEIKEGPVPRLGHLTVADLDGGGNPDVLVSDAASPHVQLLFGLARLTVAKTGNGSGTVTSVTASGVPDGGIGCGANCTETYPNDTLVMLVASPAPGSYLAGWSGMCTGVGECSVRARGDGRAVAIFAAGAAPADQGELDVGVTVSFRDAVSFNLLVSSRGGDFAADTVLVLNGISYPTAVLERSLSAVIPLATLPAGAGATTAPVQPPHVLQGDGFEWTQGAPKTWMPGSAPAPVRASHLDDLRGALVQAFALADRRPPTFGETVEDLEKMSIKRHHLQDLRRLIADLE